MKKIAIASIITLFCVFTLAFVPGTVSAQEGWEKTVTLPSGEKVLDMRGEWDVLAEPYGLARWAGPSTNIILITQEGNTFSAVRQTEDKKFPWIPKGTETIKGELDKDGFKEVQMYYKPTDSEFKWVSCKGEISEDGNTVVIDDGDRVKAMLTRR